MPATDAPAPPDLAKGVPLSSVSDGGMLGGTVGDEPVILVRSGDEVHAFGGKCTHLGAPLAKGIVADGTIRCPWHHACFDTKTGAAAAAPAFDPLAVWSVERDGDTVRVGRKQEPAPHDTPAPSPAAKPGMVIVGGGAAGYAAAVALRRAGYGGPVTMVSDDTRPPYDRTLLSKDFLDGKKGEDKLGIAKTSLADLGVAFIGGTRVRRLDRTAKQVELADGRTLPFRKLLLATGAEPDRLDVPGAELPHVAVLRTVDDARAILAITGDGQRVVVVGSSYIGLEVAASLRSRGLDVTVVTPETAPLAKRMGPALSEAVMTVHRDKGVAFRLGSEVDRIDAASVVLRDGTMLPADAVVVGIGVKPRLRLAEEAGLTLDDGVVVDAELCTSDPDIYAAGDIARWPDPHSGKAIRVEHWVVAERQGETAGANMAGGSRAFTDVPFFWSKHFDFSFRYVGHADDWDAVRVDGDLAARKAVLHYGKGGRELAALTVGQDVAALEIEREMERAG